MGHEPQTLRVVAPGGGVVRRLRGVHHVPFRIKGFYGVSWAKSISFLAASVMLPDSDG